MKKSSTPKVEVPTKIELLMQMFEIQKRASTAMFEAERAKQAGDLAAAKTWYEKQIECGKEHLVLALLHNKHHPTPVDIEPIVQPTVNAMLMFADALQSLGELKDSNRQREDAVKLSDDYLSPSGRIETKRALAAAFTSQGRFNEVLVMLTKCRDDLLQEGKPIPVVRVTIDMVDILNWLGDHARALDELNQASALLKSILGDRTPTQKDITDSIIRSALDAMRGMSFGNGASDAIALYRASMEVKYYQALIYKALHKYEEAESLFKIVLPEYEKLGVGAAIESQFAAIAVAKGEYQMGLEISERLESVFTEDDNLRPKLAVLLKLQAEALCGLGEKKQALQRLDRGIQEISTYYDPDVLWTLFLLRGRILNESENRDEALEAFTNGADVVNRLRRAPLGYRLDSTYLRDKLPLFREAIALACNLKHGRECCNLMEMVKSRILTATLSIPQREVGEAKDVDQLKRCIDQLTRELEALEYKAFKEGLPVDEVRAKAASIHRERDQVLQQIRFSDPRWRTMTEPVPFDLDTISDFLSKRKQGALNLFYREDGIMGVLVANGECITAEVKIDAEIQRALRMYLTNLNCVDVHINPTLYDPSISLMLGARDFVAADLLDRGLQCEGLVIVPHGPLHLLPWAGLIYKGRRLFEYCPVAVLPNLSSIPHLSGSLSNSPSVAMVGPPDYKHLQSFKQLPGAAKECKEILQLYSNKNRVIGEALEGSTSTEKAFWNLANHVESAGAILHIACHGLSEPNEPMHSGLILSDGRIDASEIASNSLRFDEVVLSACSTGWRPLEVQDVELTGDDILGLPGAFLEAGVRTVLVSIPVSDDEACAEFMVEYHRHRFEGKTPMAAMQQAQKLMLGNLKYEPYEWVGFTLYGCQ